MPHQAISARPSLDAPRRLHICSTAHITGASCISITQHGDITVSAYHYSHRAPIVRIRSNTPHRGQRASGPRRAAPSSRCSPSHTGAHTQHHVYTAARHHRQQNHIHCTRVHVAAASARYAAPCSRRLRSSIDALPRHRRRRCSATVARTYPRYHHYIAEQHYRHRGSLFIARVDRVHRPIHAAPGNQRKLVPRCATPTSHPQYSPHHRRILHQHHAARHHYRQRVSLFTSRAYRAHSQRYTASRPASVRTATCRSVFTMQPVTYRHPYAA